MSGINLQPIFIRERVIQLCRTFFDQQKFHEVITPVLNQAIPLEQTLFPFRTEWENIHQKKELFLSISPEASLKKMLAANIGNCYSIGKSFRNLEANGRTHNPEFLMLEWYRTGVTMEKIMTDVKGLIEFIFDNLYPEKKNYEQKIISYQGNQINIREWEVISFIELFKKYLEVDLEKIMSLEMMTELAKSKGYQTHEATWEQLFDQLYLNEIEPHLPKTPYFLIDFPLQLSPLCAPKKEMPTFAQRFELFIDGIELGNGNTENTDADYVLQSFKKVSESRKDKKMASPIDTSFIKALKSLDGQELAGIGLGVDRLAMIFADVYDIKDVEPFTIFS